MRLAVIGAGYLGAVHATAMASLGFDVVAVDIDRGRIRSLADCQPPFFEPGFQDLLQGVMAGGRLRWSTNFDDVVDADVHFLCVGTPQERGSHAADLTSLWNAMESLIPRMKAGSVLVGKSTVPVGTAADTARMIEEYWPSSTGGDPRDAPATVWNPEFLREGFAVQDTLHPDRIVVGVQDQRAEGVLREVYSSQILGGVPFIVTDWPTSELVKVAANAFLATKISFINAVAEVCEATGADVARLADAIGYDERIGRAFLGAGVGFGGGCLPKDIRAFSARAGELGVDQALTFLQAVDDINTRRRDRAVATALDLAEGSFKGRRVCVLGAAFKPNSDDVRDSPALDIAARIHNRGGEVVVHDPKALVNAASRFPALAYESDLVTALTGADVVLLLTEWVEYRELDPVGTASLVASARILDGRNVLDSRAWKDAGWIFRGMGREHG